MIPPLLFYLNFSVDKLFLFCIFHPLFSIFVLLLFSVDFDMRCASHLINVFISNCQVFMIWFLLWLIVDVNKDVVSYYDLMPVEGLWQKHDLVLTVCMSSLPLFPECFQNDSQLHIFIYPLCIFEHYQKKKKKQLL